MRRIAPPLPAASQPSNTRIVEIRPWPAPCAAGDSAGPGTSRASRREGLLRERLRHVEAVQDRRQARRPLATARGGSRARLRRADGAGGRSELAFAGPAPLRSASAFRMRVADGRRDRQAAIGLVDALDDRPRRRSDVLVRCSARSAAATKRSYMRQCCHCSFVTRQRVSGSFSSFRRRFFCAFFPRCIQNFRMTAPSSVSVRSKPAMRSSCWSKSGRAAAAIYAIEHRPGIPRAQEQADAALPRQVPPVAPVLRPLALFVRRLAVRARDESSADPSTRSAG